MIGELRKGHVRLLWWGFTRLSETWGEWLPPLDVDRYISKYIKEEPKFRRTKIFPYTMLACMLAYIHADRSTSEVHDSGLTGSLVLELLATTNRIRSAAGSSHVPGRTASRPAPPWQRGVGPQVCRSCG